LWDSQKLLLLGAIPHPIGGKKIKEKIKKYESEGEKI
jgi:hypothetical protein